MSGGVILIAGLLQGGWASAVFSWGPLRWTGRISYGLYLWHYPIILIVQPHLLQEPRGVRLAVLALASYAAAAASYYLLERYFLRRKSRSERVPTLVAVASNSTR
jgi:peptidoglycan/LPS O-acetylase OafA/YrhL